jgi:hypothetical protein
LSPTSRVVSVAANSPAPAKRVEQRALPLGLRAMSPGESLDRLDHVE